jgi:hypothetical protein
MAKGARSKARKRNNREKRNKIAKIEIARNERLYKKLEEIRKQSTLQNTDLQKNNIQDLPTANRISITIHDEATDETETKNTFQTPLESMDAESEEELPATPRPNRFSSGRLPRLAYKRINAGTSRDLGTRGIHKRSRSRRRNINPRPQHKKHF